MLSAAMSALKSMFKGYALQLIAGLSGFWAVLAKIGLKFLIWAFSKMEVMQREREAAKKKLDAYEKVINNQKSTAEEVSDSASDFLK